MDVLLALLSGVGQTLLITGGALVFGMVFAVPLVAMRRSSSRVLSGIAATLIEAIRGVPVIVWLLLIYFALGTSLIKLTTLQAAILGLGIVAAVLIAEIYRSGLDATPAGQWEAAEALAIPLSSAYRRVVIPQAVVVIVPQLASYAIGLLKDSAIASIIGAQDITFRAYQEAQSNLSGLTTFFIAALLYIALSVPIAVLARYTGSRVAARMGA
ncbi:MAG TPA: amino acid ABC transporter permease [Microbacterium sp.]|nr:amino acid ABC transporter permease [Microbacterium sp.]